MAPLTSAYITLSSSPDCLCIYHAGQNVVYRRAFPTEFSENCILCITHLGISRLYQRVGEDSQPLEKNLFSPRINIDYMWKIDRKWDSKRKKKQVEDKYENEGKEGKRKIRKLFWNSLSSFTTRDVKL